MIRWLKKKLQVILVYWEKFSYKQFLNGPCTFIHVNPMESYLYIYYFNMINHGNHPKALKVKDMFDNQNFNGCVFHCLSNNRYLSYE